MNDKSMAATKGTAGRCPVCGSATEKRWRPFCSRRCADVDLGRWLKGSYAIPGEPLETEGAERDGIASSPPEDEEDR